MAIRILLVDDDPLVLLSTKRIVEASGLDVTAVCCVEDAKKALNTNHFSALVSDVLMPNGTGVELHEWVSRYHPYLMSKIIFCSGGMPSDLEEYIRKSGCCLFKKPIDGNALVEVLHGVRPSTSSRPVASDGASTRGI